MRLQADAVRLQADADRWEKEAGAVDGRVFQVAVPCTTSDSHLTEVILDCDCGLALEHVTRHEMVQP